MPSSTLTHADPLPASSARTASALAFFGLGGFALLWLELVNHLRSEWTLNPQYSYGWSVPFLAIFVFWQRWQVRPSTDPFRSRTIAIALALVATVALLPARIIGIANPDWRLLSWSLAGLVVAVSFSALYLAGGLRWMRHFAFPILFFVVAVPWPAQFEQNVVQTLMRADAAITIELLNTFGTLAVQHGNVIELSTGMVGIDDACTGVRSLQATLMLSLFLGELYRLVPWRRVALIGTGAALAFFCNIVRTLVLCLVGAGKGIAAIHQWHDPAGLTILMTCLFGLWAASLALRPRVGPVNPANVSGLEPALLGSALRLGVALLSWLVVTEVTAAAWYHDQAGTLIKTGAWTVAWPSPETGFQPTDVPQAAQELLRYNEGGGGSWSSGDSRWTMYFFRWLPGRTAALFVKNHRPDICLPASGITLQKDNGIQLEHVAGADLPIHSYRFEDQNRQPLHVFYCYWDGRTSYGSNAQAADEDWTARGRLRAAWRGQRDVGSKMLEIAVWGYSDDGKAREALRRELEKIVVAAG